ncbi:MULTISPECIES: GspH/FimT family pseudopilin [Thiorhodovibrio]|uniref:GspH/FimT family pseudopilin n=1 Tax=Thiorhodovibrio TaxID=61593 RepID=UPI001913B1EA|nr:MULTISPECIES: GspH/FimT family pseudopilin [Thiorhodovibrio]MBK5971208.1 type II secretion system protein GspH [Thiorhodovibrio winogradskyi]WPL14643.1 type II secretion system protein H [Thiorhodovibrio litoralis]
MRALNISEHGFTLVELLVVLAIAGLMLSLTPPLISAALPGVELKAAARRTASALRVTRELAISSGQDQAWVLNVADNRYRIAATGRDGRLPSGIDLKLLGAEREMRGDDEGGVRFFPDGSSTGGNVILTRDGHGYQVGVNWLTGRVLIADWEPD